MSDLNSFFAKRDRKKKKGANRTAPPAVPASSVAQGSTDLPATAAADPAPAAQTTSKPAAQSDDGWIELDDAKSAQVNTGGRVVGQFKRGADAAETTRAQEKEAAGEKFSGWTLKAGEEEEKPAEEPVEEDEGKKLRTRMPWKPAGPDVNSASLFPSLQATADAPKVPQSVKTGVGAGGGVPGRPRFVNSGRGGSASGYSSSSAGGAAGRPRFINSNPNKFAELDK